MLLFFDKMILRVCAASKIQTNWRAHLMRRRFQRTEYPIKSVIRQRSALCIQRFWSDTKFRKRLIGLETIKNHIIQISSRVLYVEQSIYNNLKQIAKMIETQLRFEEQTLDFDFNQLNSQVCLFVNENHKYVQRYQQQAVPQWFGLPFRCIDFRQTAHFNDLQALFHLNEMDAEVLPVNYVINHKAKEVDID